MTNNKKLKKFLKELDKDIVKNGRTAKKEIKKAAKNAEPLVKKTREALLELGKIMEKKAKKACRDFKK
jgi:ElaB/YqjD/DUF883 family membrane-anchored ribosome-binding protein